MEFKGTKGNWGVYGTSDCVSIENSNAESICAINSITISKEEYQANAKLIACAPEMLEYLIKTRYRLDNIDLELEQLIKKAIS